jgi:hypothetical protein
MEKPISEAEFFEVCETTLTEKNFLILQSARLVPFEEKSKTTIIEKWNCWERGLRNELVKMRASKKSQDSEKYIPEGNTEIGVFEVAREAFQAPSPLEAESILNRARWDYLEELEAGHYFNFSTIIVYYLKLQLLQRRAQINKEKGKTAFNEIYTVIHDENSAKESS